MAKKGLMSLFVQVEESKEPEIDLNALMEHQAIDVSVDASNVISVDDIYSANDLGDKSRSVFKIKEFKDAMPKEIPDSAKKNAVLGAISVSGLDLEHLIQDADARITTLKTALEGFSTAVTTDIEDARGKIAELEQLIEEQKGIISKRNKDLEDQTEIINAELKRIQEIKEFIS